MTAYADSFDTLMKFETLISKILLVTIPRSLTTGLNFWYKYYPRNAKRLRSTIHWRHQMR